MLKKAMEYLELRWHNLKYDARSLYYKTKYKDYEDDECSCGSIKHIWGVKSWDDLTGKECNLYTMNDIDIIFDRGTKKYMLSIETAYMFKDKQSECEYLRELLNAFTHYIEANDIVVEEYCLFMSHDLANNMADTISELYANFRIFVEGFCKCYERTVD